MELSRDKAARAVRAHEVINPSETIALGDAFIGSEKAIEDGRNFYRSRQAKDVEGSTARSNKRHKGKGNVAFADGHVGPVELKTLFADRSESVLSMWNRDHQPHADIAP